MIKIKKQRKYQSFNVIALPNYVKQSNKYFKIEMEESSQFTIRQIVWAKVGNYPWWPAKIVDSLTQQHRKLYKVNFFGDPTYCYLECQYLLTFESGLARSQSQSNDFKLEKPVQLAKAALRKIKSTFQMPSNTFKNAHQPSAILESFPECEEEGKVQQKCFEEKIEKLDIESSCRFHQSTSSPPQCSFQQITTYNVVDILSDSSFHSLQLLKGYNNRKQFRQINQKLREKLLQKYNLHAYQQPRQQKESRILPLQPQKRILIRKLKHKKLKKNQQYVRNSCGRKLYKMLKRKAKCSNSKRIVLQMMQKLGGFEGDRKKYRQMYRSISSWIHTEESQYEQSYRKQDEQKTKLTPLTD